jgi:predicted PurR-regulated permease PerM
MGVGGYFLSDPVSEIVESAPTIGLRLKSKLTTFRDSVDTIGNVSEQVDSALSGDKADDSVSEVVIKQPGLVSSATSSLLSGLTSIALALMLALFLLASGNMFYEKLVAVMPVLSEKKRALRIVYDVEGNVSRYLFTITLINMALGVVIATLLFLYGMPNAALWGVIAAVSNFLPFVGALFGAGLLAAVSLGHFVGLWPALIPPAIYLACTTLEGNVLTPLIVGRRLELNVVAVFLAVALWGWLWGVAGALMAVPLLVVFKVLCDHVDTLSMWAEFLSGKRASRDTSEAAVTSDTSKTSRTSA